MKLKKIVILSAVLAFVAASNIQTVFASELKPEPTEIISRLVELGIPNEFHADLVVKIQNSIPLDSDIANSNPVSSTRSVKNGFEIIRESFRDGSVSIFSSQLPVDSRLRASVSNCTVNVGSGYKNYSNCSVTNATINVVFGFVADFGLVNGGYDSIFAVRNPVTRCYLGSCADTVLALVKRKESLSGPAEASLTTEFVLAGGWASRTQVLTLLVGQDKYYLDVFN